MIKAKERIRPRSIRVILCLGWGLSFLDLGCSTIAGLRPAGSERPSLLRFMDRPRTPTAAGGPDYYAENMRAAHERAVRSANESAVAVAGRSGDKMPAAMPAAETVPSGSRGTPTRRPDPATVPTRDGTIHVTLGPPELLPSLPAPAKPPENVASSPTSLSGTAVVGRPDPSVTPAPSGINPKDRARPAGQDRASRPRSPDKDNAESILSQAAAKLGRLDTYQAKVTRVERVSGHLQPEEEILLSVRRKPQAVRLEWLSGPSKGREVIYSSALDQRTLFVHMANSPIPLPTMKIPVDSPMVMKNSRHSITEAGFDIIIENLQKSNREKGLEYKGLEKVPGLDRSAHHFVRQTPKETWNIYLDARTLLPALVNGADERGEIIERYLYQEVREGPAELAAADAFEPDRRWGQAEGLLSRFAQGVTPTAGSSTNGSTTK